MEEQLKLTRARAVVHYRESSDPKVSGAGIQVKTGRKWRAEEAVQEAGARLRQRELVGVVTRDICKGLATPGGAGVAWSGLKRFGHRGREIEGSHSCHHQSGRKSL